MPSEKINLGDPRTEKVKFLDTLLAKANSAIQKRDDSNLRNCYMQYIVFCRNLKISTHFYNINFNDAIKYETFKKDFISDIEGVLATCKLQEPNYQQKAETYIINSQVQNQQMNLSIVMSSLQESLNEKQFKTIQKLIKNRADHQTIKDKLMSFGINVLSNVLANLLITKC